jgi:hypothetical protein
MVSSFFVVLYDYISTVLVNPIAFIMFVYDLHNNICWVALGVNKKNLYR